MSVSEAVEPEVPQVASSDVGFVLALEEATLEVSCSAEITVGELVGRAMSQYRLFRFDLKGQSLGWYRLAQSGAMLDSAVAMDALQSTSDLSLEWRAQDALRVEIEVEMEDASNLRFQTDLATAVPVDALVAHLRSWLGLDEGDWGLHAGSERLNGGMILEEADLTQGAVLVVKR